MPAVYDASKADAGLDEWIAEQQHKSAEEIFLAVSATTLTKPRFWSPITARKGSVVASRFLASYDPDPDYFFHWLRDSALVMDAVRVLGQQSECRALARRSFRDFVTFSLGLENLSGADIDHDQLVKSAATDQARFLRCPEELRQILGDRIFCETRFNPDGSLDVLRWPRPQNDGPALRALTNLRYWSAAVETNSKATARLRRLIIADLDFVRHNWKDPSYDVWEEELGLHYYTQLVQIAALEQGAIWARGETSDAAARELAAAAVQLRRRLAFHWSEEHGAYISRRGPGTATDKAIDASVLLGVINAGRMRGPHSVTDTRVHATLAKVENLFVTTLPLNARLNGSLGPAIGRYRGDTYYGGGAFLVTTLAVAELYYRLAASAAQGCLLGETIGVLLGRLPEGSGRESPAVRLFDRGDAYMRTVRTFTPQSGLLPEQFDAATGVPQSCKNLAWSHAAFVTAVASRNHAAELADTKAGLTKRSAARSAGGKPAASARAPGRC